MTSEFSSQIQELVTNIGTTDSEKPSLDVKRLIKLRSPIIIAVSLALAIPGVLAAWFLTTLEYTATADIRFLATTPSVMNVNMVTTPYTTFVQTQLSILTGTEIMTRVYDKPEIAILSCFKDVTDEVSFLKSKITARPQSRGEIVTVGFSLPDRKQAEDILKEIISQYRSFALNEGANVGYKQLEILRNERDARELELETIRSQIVNIQSNANVLHPDAAELYREKLIEAQDFVTSMENRLVEGKKQLDTVETLQKQLQTSSRKPIYQLGIEGKISTEPRVVTLRQQIVLVEADLAELKKRMPKDSPKLSSDSLKLQTRRDSLSESLAQLEGRVRAEMLSSLHAQINEQVEREQKQLEDAGGQKDKFQELLNDELAASGDMAEHLANLERLKRNEEEMTTLLQEVRRRITQISIEGQAAPRVEQMSDVHVPQKPGYGRRFQVMALTTMIAICIGIGVGLWCEINDQQVRTAQDIARITRLPVIASIPYAYEDSTLKSASIPLLMAEFPVSTIAEEFRRVLSRILYPEDNSGAFHSLLISSPTQSDGKTSLACNLATALANANRRVLLMEICSIRPCIEKCFDLEPSLGLAEVLSGKKRPQEAIRPSGLDGLHILGCGFSSEGLAGALVSREMMLFLEWCESEFDHVIIDSPPSLLMANAKLVAPLADAMILVVGVGQSTQGMLHRSLRELEQVGTNVIGIVLNGQRQTRGGYIANNLKMYYEYSDRSDDAKQDEEIPAMKILDEKDEQEHPVLLPLDDENTQDEDEIYDAVLEGDDTDQIELGFPGTGQPEEKRT